MHSKALSSFSFLLIVLALAAASRAQAVSRSFSAGGQVLVNAVASIDKAQRNLIRLQMAIKDNRSSFTYISYYFPRITSAILADTDYSEQVFNDDYLEFEETVYNRIANGARVLRDDALPQLRNITASNSTNNNADSITAALLFTVGLANDLYNVSQRDLQIISDNLATYGPVYDSLSVASKNRVVAFTNRVNALLNNLQKSFSQGRSQLIALVNAAA